MLGAMGWELMPFRLLTESSGPTKKSRGPCTSTPCARTAGPNRLKLGDRIGNITRCPFFASMYAGVLYGLVECDLRFFFALFLLVFPSPRPFFKISSNLHENLSAASSWGTHGTAFAPWGIDWFCCARFDIFS